MKILLITDGRYPKHVNGVSIYIRYLAEEMVKNGQEVHIFHHIKSGFLNRPKIIRSMENGIIYHGLQNSPISFSEAIIHPQRSCCEKKTEKIFSDLLKEVNPDIVHFHEFHRTPSHCIALCKVQNIPTMVTLHDYWFICPRTQLFTLNESLCEGPNEGKNCIIHCLAGDYLTRQYRKMLIKLPHGNLLRGFKTLRNIYKKIRGEPPGQTTPNPMVRRKHDHIKGDDQLREAFRLREIENKNALLKADLILAVSTSVKEIFERHGVSNQVVVNQLGVKSASWIKRKVRRFVRYPVRFGFLGHLGPLKGAHLIIEAAKTISPQKAEFLFFGSGNDDTLTDYKKRTEGLSHCQYMGRYDYQMLDQIFDRFDMLIIPSLCQETLGMIGLEAQASGIPVIASNIGGMRDYIRQDINGLLFRVGDLDALKRQLDTILESPHKIEEMSKHAAQPKTIEQNCQEMIGYYDSVIRQSPNKHKKCNSPLSHQILKP